ncbi:hypothetical protein AGMMS49975_25240 [Clostridia bacterium]|nr:hypothetical protein AGMMS49975_25240 [Clostridia bacterium]
MKQKIRFLFYLLAHPIDGYYELRHRGRGSFPLALFVVVLFSISLSINKIYASIIVNDIDPRTVDSLGELRGVLLFYFALCAANWSVTALLSGEGRMKDILISVGYAFTPMVLVFLPATLFSQTVSLYEAVFYNVFMGVGVVWSCVLFLIGIMVVHNYSFGKTFVTIFLTFISLLLMIFFAALMTDLLKNLFDFVRSLYTELSL